MGLHHTYIEGEHIRNIFSLECEVHHFPGTALRQHCILDSATEFYIAEYLIHSGDSMYSSPAIDLSALPHHWSERCAVTDDDPSLLPPGTYVYL